MGKESHSPAGRGKLTPLVLGHLGGGSPSAVVGRLIYSHVNIRERNSDTFPIKNNQMHFWALLGVVKTLLSTIMCEAEKYCRVPTGRVRILLYFVLFCRCFFIGIKPWSQLPRFIAASRWTGGGNKSRPGS